MNLLTIEHINKTFGDKVIFDDASFGVQEGDKIGIIGINGTGKTTLLKMLAGLENPEQGQVAMQKGVKIAYLPQHPRFPDGATALSAVLDGAGQRRDQEGEAKAMLNRLGILDPDVVVGTLSGGQKKRVALAKTLSADFDLLLLDEPTNHLDSEMAAWLEEYLRKQRCTILMVTHDRYFLDRVTNKILEIDHGKMYGYEANYSKFLEMKAKREEMELSSDRKRQSKLRGELQWAQRGCRARSTKQKARLLRLEELKNSGASANNAAVEIETVSARMGKKTVELHHVSKSYGEKVLIRDFTTIVLRNQRLGFVGPNGCGKSTMLKLICGMEQPDSGVVELGDTIRIGYFAQEVPDMDTGERVIDYVRSIAEYVPVKEGKISAAQLLERFLFTPEMQYAPISKLSGGEKKRLYLLGILMAGPNCLVLDEITNDIDIPTLAVLEDYLSSFPGIVITVSHDRYFLDNVADRIFAFEEEGRLRQYEGGYTDYLEALQARMGKEVLEAAEQTKKQQACKHGLDSSKGPKNLQETEGKSWKNRPARLKFTFKEQREYETIDGEIAKLEEAIEALEMEMEASASQYAKLTQLSEEKEKLLAVLEEKMDRWVYLNDLAERIEAQEIKSCGK